MESQVFSPIRILILSTDQQGRCQPTLATKYLNKSLSRSRLPVLMIGTYLVPRKQIHNIISASKEEALISEEATLVQQTLSDLE